MGNEARRAGGMESPGMTDTDIIERIAEAVAARVKVPLGVQLWSADEIAAYLSVMGAWALPGPVQVSVSAGSRTSSSGTLPSRASHAATSNPGHVLCTSGRSRWPMILADG